ncbi:MAG TPA: hypothetical protein VHA52_05960, partial [Candidatus Babeliaceae bacterium]|nr:hypothetical protein [Candidatus Babeliaceae bacterium]
NYMRQIRLPLVFQIRNNFSKPQELSPWGKAQQEIVEIILELRKHDLKNIEEAFNDHGSFLGTLHSDLRDKFIEEYILGEVTSEDEKVVNFIRKYRAAENLVFRATSSIESFSIFHLGIASRILDTIRRCEESLDELKKTLQVFRSLPHPKTSYYRHFFDVKEIITVGKHTLLTVKGVEGLIQRWETEKTKFPTVQKNAQVKKKWLERIFCSGLALIGIGILFHLIRQHRRLAL